MDDGAVGGNSHVAYFEGGQIKEFVDGIQKQGQEQHLRIVRVIADAVIGGSQCSYVQKAVLRCEPEDLELFAIPELPASYTMNTTITDTRWPKSRDTWQQVNYISNHIPKCWHSGPTKLSWEKSLERARRRRSASTTEEPPEDSKGSFITTPRPRRSVDHQGVC